MKLYAVQPEREDLLHVFLNIGAVGVKRTETGHFPAAFLHGRGDEMIDRRNLFGCRRYRLYDIMIDHALSFLQKSSDRAVVTHVDPVKFSRSRRGFQRDLIGVNVTMGVHGSIMLHGCSSFPQGVLFACCVFHRLQF